MKVGDKVEHSGMEFEVISTYTSAEAVADGILIRVPEAMGLLHFFGCIVSFFLSMMSLIM